MKWVGAHVSIAGGVKKAPENAKKIGARAFALFTRNQRQWKISPLSRQDIRDFKEKCRKNGFSPSRIIAHNSYLINLGHPEKAGVEKSRKAFIAEIKRCHQLEIPCLIFHPGNHKNLISENACLERIAESLNLALEATRDVIAVLETTAGQGSSLGYRFEQLASIIERIENKNRIGVCLDTCHIFAAGYDIRTSETYRRVMHQFNQIIGFRYLKGVHLNDSKSKLSSRIDRHQGIGKGELGLKTFRLIMNDLRMESLPLILETTDPIIWPDEIRLLYSLVR